ncbi:hypothetical protein Clacol_010615 [Clathrus columnatus]|uniref:Uncharacterized protein n=1 Tax=Clathrus columnatus TaxID=1419009 RepID=A0AAV5AUJ7_9AGAM|nr:hypothetical protein Clacol_010615 [Clathrus columnatus]
MFFSYPQWLGQAPDPSMTIPPQPIFKSTSWTRPEKKKTPSVAETATSSADTTSLDSNTSSHRSTHVDSSPKPSWQEADSKTDSDSHSNGTSITEEYIYPSETFTSPKPTPWSEDNLPNNQEYFSAGQPFEPEAAAGQPPAYQETETYFHRFSDFYPAYVHLPPLNYVHLEHYSIPFPKPEFFFHGWCDNVMNECQKDFDIHKNSGDNPQRRATWSSPPFTTSKSKETSRVPPPKEETPPEEAPEMIRKSPKLGTYSFTFFTQRETSPTTELNRELKNMSSLDTLKSRSTTATRASRKPFVYTKPLTLKDALAQYEKHWEILSESNSSVTWNFHTIPWPQFPPPLSIEDINARRIRRFLLTGNVNTKALLRKALLRFHPDKIPKLLLNVEEKDKDQVSQGCMTVAKCLNEIKGTL